jgi:DsbC/DsbD-like thiol-disulfide interchange protein
VKGLSRRRLLGGAALLIPIIAAAQIQLGGFDRATQAKKQHVDLLTDSLQLTPGKLQTVEIRFRVEPGFHINSHTPHDETLIPTNLRLDPVNGIRVKALSYPAGSPFHLNVGAGETLGIYQGEFRVSVALTPESQSSTLTGSLHYQACDTASCFPPRMLPIQIAVTTR